jgi:lipoprotein-releasing system ATP-binding protein
MIIEARGIHKSYDELLVLKNVNISVNKGEIVSIVGPSGAGKSTLLNILGTIDKADQGTVMINDRDISLLKSNELSLFRSKHIGFIFQHHHLLPEFSALENVCMPSLIAGNSKKKAENRASALLSYLGLSERLHHKPSQLSGGEMQRVSVARALANNPDIILADEPSGNLDTKNAEELHALFLKLQKEFQQTFIIVTHNLKLAEMSNRIIELRDGRIYS